MKETARIAELFEKIYNGDSWIGESLMNTLENIPAESVAKRIAPRWNTAWEIVNHIISWRENVLQRVQGTVTHEPDDNYITPVKDTSEKAWQKTLQALKNSQEKWIAFLQKMDEEDLEKIYANKYSSYYNNIHGIIQHDAYHLGQIILLVKNTVDNE